MRKLQADWVFTVNDVLSSLPNNYEFEQRPQVVQEKDPEPNDVPGRVYKRLRKNGQPVPKPTVRSELPSQSIPKQPRLVPDIKQCGDVKGKSKVYK